jgi:transcriptional regulator with XRE-family HTH domain
MSDQEKSDGDFLRNARERLKMTQEQLGEAIGIGRVEVYRKESGTRSLSLAQRLAVKYLLLRKKLPA